MKKAVTFFVVLALLSCKKDKTQQLTINGTVTDGVNGGGVSNVVVSLSYQPYQNGVASASFTSLGTYTTSTDGYYSFTFDKPTSLKYRIELSRSDYFGVSQEINPDDLSTSENNT